MWSLFKALKVVLYYNAVSIPCTYDNQNIGHLVLVATDANYKSIIPNDAPRVPPVQPLTAPIISHNAPIQSQITEALWKHQIQTAEWTLYKQTKAAVVRQVVSVANKEFLLPMHHVLLGYARCSPRKLMQNFLNNYAKFDEAEKKTKRT